MTRIARLYSAVLDNPRASLSFRDFERLLSAFGFRPDRVTGGHRQYVHDAVPRPFSVQPDGEDAKRYQLCELLDMIEAYGSSIDE